MNPTVPPALRVLLAGWALFVLMWLLVVVVRPDDAVPVAVFVALGLLLAVWVVRRRSRAALVTSLVVGILHTLEQVAYTVAELGAEPVETSVVAIDLLGLVSGLLIAGGAAAALRARRRADRELPQPVRSG